MQGIRDIEQAASIADPIERLRALQGAREVMYAYLNEVRADAIREARESGMSVVDISRQLGVSDVRVVHMANHNRTSKKKAKRG